MEKKRFFKTTEFRCFFAAVAEFLVLLLWGLNMDAVDAMAFALLTIYSLIPLTALILSAVLAKKNLKAAIVMTILMTLIEVFLPFIIYGTFEVVLCLAISIIPCGIGILIGHLCKKK